MCIVRHVEMKFVLTFQPIERFVSTILKSTSLISRAEHSFQGPKPTIMLCGVMVHIASQETRVATTEKRNHLQF